MAPSMDGSSAAPSRNTSFANLQSDVAVGGMHPAAAVYQRAAVQHHRSPGFMIPKVPSLVFDIELEEGTRGGAGHEDDSAGVKELARWLAPASTGEWKLRNDVELALGQQPPQQPAAASIQSSTCTSSSSGSPTSGSSPTNSSSSSYLLDKNQWLASRLGRLGYVVHVRTALGGGDGFECLRNLRHVFLTVMPPGAHATTNRYVVDLSFKEQFAIAKPTTRYAALLGCIPEVYVAPEASVPPLVNFMCAEMAAAFRSTGSVLPPWRHTTSMLSKWMPRKSLEEVVPVSSSSSFGSFAGLGGSAAAWCKDAAAGGGRVRGGVPTGCQPSVSVSAAGATGEGPAAAAPHHGMLMRSNSRTGEVFMTTATTTAPMMSCSVTTGGLPVRRHWVAPLQQQQQPGTGAEQRANNNTAGIGFDATSQTQGQQQLQQQQRPSQLVAPPRMVPPTSSSHQGLHMQQQWKQGMQPQQQQSEQQPPLGGMPIGRWGCNAAEVVLGGSGRQGFVVGGGSSGAVCKPISCQPQRVVVGGNFATVGNA